MTKDKRTISFNEHTTKTVDRLPFLSPSFDFSVKVDSLINDHTNLIEFTKIELINFFTEAEANLLVDSLNGVHTVSQISPAKLLKSSISDSMQLYRFDVKWNVDKTALTGKLSRLTSFQAYVVTLMVREYWNSEDPDKTDIKEIFLIRNN